MKTLADLKKGEIGIIQSFTNDDTLSLKMLEMGCLPGMEVCLRYAAPLGDPICIQIAGSSFALRRSEANQIVIKSN